MIDRTRNVKQRSLLSTDLEQLVYSTFQHSPPLPRADSYHFFLFLRWSALGLVGWLSVEAQEFVQAFAGVELFAGACIGVRDDALVEVH